MNDATARALRQAFDASFRAAPAESLPHEDFLAIRVGGEPYAVRLAEVAGLHVDRKIVPFPSRAAESLGIAGLRGLLAPIYDLGALIGYPTGAPPRWLLLARGADPLGLAFERFEAHLRCTSDQISSPEKEEHARRHLRGAVHSDGVSRPLIDISLVLATLARHSKER